MIYFNIQSGSFALIMSFFSQHNIKTMKRTHIQLICPHAHTLCTLVIRLHFRCTELFHHSVEILGFRLWLYSTLRLGVTSIKVKSFLTDIPLSCSSSVPPLFPSTQVFKSVLKSSPFLLLLPLLLSSLLSALICLMFLSPDPL